MCDGKPGLRCISDMDKAVKAKTAAYADAVAAHADDIDSAASIERVNNAAGELWVARIEQAGAYAHRGRDLPAGWVSDVGSSLARARQDQAALMPVKPAKDAPVAVRRAYRELAEARDALALSDAVLTADEQIPLNGTPQPGPAFGPRPIALNPEMKVAAAEQRYAGLAHAGTPATTGERWRALVTRGYMPYDPFSDPAHPTAAQSAPWVRHHRPAEPIDVETVRRAYGEPGDVSWDEDSKTVVVEPDSEGYMEPDEREYLAQRIEQSLWQLGFHTEREGSTVTICRSPDIHAWRKATDSTRKAVAA